MRVARIKYVWDQYAAGGWWFVDGKMVGPEHPAVASLSADEQEAICEAGKFKECPHCGGPVERDFV